MPAAPTTTSYAILGLLAIRPWTSYELAQQMRRALGRFWPRAESNLYEEPKKLVALGLAAATRERLGKRQRTVYTITPEGRSALAAWLPVPGSAPVLEFDELVKVFFAEFGSKADLLAAIGRARTWAEEEVASTITIPRDYLQGQGPFPERLPWLILIGRFIDDFNHCVHRWAEWAAEVVETWPDDLRAAAPDWAALEAMAVRGDDVLRAAADRRRSSAVPPP